MRYDKTLSILLFVVLDYFALVGAEQCAFWIRNSFFHSSYLHISWLNFWIVFPSLYIFFLNMGQLYSRRRPFYKEVEQLFRASCYGTLAVIFILYVCNVKIYIIKC